MRCRTCPLCGGQHADDVFCIRFIADRVKELESKLGAASQRESATREDAEPIPAGDRNLALSQAAAPSVSLGSWRDIAHVNRVDGQLEVARACDLAAALTEAYESTKHLAYADHPQRVSQFTRIALAFVRGEPLPEKGK